MTSKELFNKIKPVEEIRYTGQLLSSGMSWNHVDMFTRFIRDAARCNDYCSDVFNDMAYIDKRMKEFDPKKEFEPIWIGFRKMGVDGTSNVLFRVEDCSSVYGPLERNYFALYSITVKDNGYGFYDIILNKYGV